jgi:hypothetical protein
MATASLRRSVHDHRDSLEIGQGAENAFALIAAARGWYVGAASSESDRNAHWDFVIARRQTRYLVDVKSRKRRHRHANAFEENWTWIELHGTRPDDLGWLYDGQADLIAFETESTFLIAQRKRLISLVEDTVDFCTVTYSPGHAYYAVYHRGAHDQITLVETARIRTIRWDEWSKVEQPHRSHR